MFYKIQHNQIIYDFQKSLQHITEEGKQLYGNHFELFIEDMNIIRKVFAFVVNDVESMIALKMDPRKGLMITGPVGVGKTSLLNLSRLLLPADHRFQIKPCRDISFEFHKKGFDVIHQYSNKSFKIVPGRKIPLTICFDDMGAEYSLKHFGNQCNVIAEILLSRYDLFISDGLKTIITTNLNASEIEKQYGPRIRSRLREMVNVISFPDETNDKRK